jgi:DNA (cytosine-5)-methyltransferase 1
VSVAVEKPPYRVPTMGEIAATPPNGMRAMSTFSGCGGSCLGYEMAGYDVVWANDIDQQAHSIFRANHPKTILDTRGIREITDRPDVGEIDLLDGSPPCASFSSAGKGSEGWGQDRVYNGIAQREDDLFDEYVRFIGMIRPKVFVAENVYGLIRGKAVGYFKRVHQAMRDQGYRVEARVLDACRLGVPQLRPRVIFIGVREDLERDPVFPAPDPYVYTLRDAIGSMSDAERNIEGQEWVVREKVAKYWRSLKPGEAHSVHFNVQRLAWDRPCRTILTVTTPSFVALMPDEIRALSVNECRRVCSFPDDFDFGRQGEISARAWYHKRMERMGLAVPPVMMRRISETIRDEILT